jgi:hypothetical protein
MGRSQYDRELRDLARSIAPARPSAWMADLKRAMPANDNVRPSLWRNLVRRLKNVLKI